MIILQVPTQANLPWYKFSISLSGTVYVLALRYNPRMQRWILDINDPSNNPLLMGLPVLIKRNVNGQYVFVGLPVGTFFALPNTQNQDQPTVNSFQTTHLLLYADPTQ